MNEGQTKSKILAPLTSGRARRPRLAGAARTPSGGDSPWAEGEGRNREGEKMPTSSPSEGAETRGAACSSATSRLPKWRGAAKGATPPPPPPLPPTAPLHAAGPSPTLALPRTHACTQTHTARLPPARRGQAAQHGGDVTAGTTPTAQPRPGPPPAPPAPEGLSLAGRLLVMQSADFFKLRKNTGLLTLYVAHYHK